MTGEIFFEFEFCFGDVWHFLSFYFLSILDDFVDFQEVFLSMGTNLSTGSEGNLVFNFFPVFSKMNNGCIRGDKYHLKNLGANLDSICPLSWWKGLDFRERDFRTETRKFFLRRGS